MKFRQLSTLALALLLAINVSARGKNNDEGSNVKSQKDYGNNLVAFAPLQISEGVGLGLSYERVLDKKNGILSLYIPIIFSFNDLATDPYISPGPGGTTTTNNNRSLYVMAGLKFYPTGSKGVVRYAIGPTFAYITGQKYVNEYIYDNQGMIIGQDIGNRTRTAIGIMVNNSLNINPTSNLYLGLELGLGFTYFNKVGNIETNPQALAQFGFKLGYRF